MNTEATQNNTESTIPGERLRQARERLGMSQQTVAERLCLKLSTVREIEDGNTPTDLAPTFYVVISVLMRSWFTCRRVNCYPCWTSMWLPGRRMWPHAEFFLRKKPQEAGRLVNDLHLAGGDCRPGADRRMVVAESSGAAAGDQLHGRPRQLATGAE